MNATHIVTWFKWLVKQFLRNLKLAKVAQCSLKMKIKEYKINADKAENTNFLFNEKLLVPIKLFCLVSRNKNTAYLWSLKVPFINPYCYCRIWTIESIYNIMFIQKPSEKKIQAIIIPRCKINLNGLEYSW